MLSLCTGVFSIMQFLIVGCVCGRICKNVPNSIFSEMDFDIIIYFSFKPHTSCFMELARSVAKIRHLFSTDL